LKNVSQDFFAIGNFKKAKKIFERLHTFFKSKDSKTNYCEED